MKKIDLRKLHFCAKLLKYFPILLLFINICFAQKHYTGQSIEDVLSLPEKEISLCIATLVLAKDFYPDMKVELFIYTLEYMASRFKYYSGEYITPEERIGALNSFIYRKGYWNDWITFTYTEDEIPTEDINNMFINGYLATKTGSCITMPMLYILIGEKLGWPIYPATAPRHYFARYITDEFTTINSELNIETTCGGGIYPDEALIEDMSIPEKAIKNGVYMKTLTKKEYIASLVSMSANKFAEGGNFERARYLYELSLKYYPALAIAYRNLARLNYTEAAILDKRMRSEKNAENSFYRMSGGDNTERTASLMSITQKYAPMIQEKMKAYYENKQKALDLGFVENATYDYFKTQTEQLKEYQIEGKNKNVEIR